MQSVSPKRPDPPWGASRWAAVVAVGAAVCLAVGVIVKHRSNPEPRDPARSAESAPVENGDEAPAEALSAARPGDEHALEEPDPAVAPPSTFIPWAWLDQPAQPAEATPKSREAAAPDTASAADVPPEGISGAEVQRVAGGQSADAGAAEQAPANAPEAGAPPPETDTEPEPAPGPIQAGESCGFITCAQGYSCCNPSCGVCVAPGDNCDPTPCRSRIQYPSSMVCGRSTCSVNQVCCNPSCGICVNPGESCDETPCDNAIQYPFSPICGRTTCTINQVCCNPSCGICVSPGETCSQQPCQ